MSWRTEGFVWLGFWTLSIFVGVFLAFCDGVHGAIAGALMGIGLVCSVLTAGQLYDDRDYE